MPLGGSGAARYANSYGQPEQSGAGVRIRGAAFRSKPVGFSSAVFCCGGVEDSRYCRRIDGWRHCRNDRRRPASTDLKYGGRENLQLQSGQLLPQWRSDDKRAAAACRPRAAWACNTLPPLRSTRFSITCLQRSDPGMPRAYAARLS